MNERKTALLLFQEDIDEAFQLWLINHPEVNITVPFTFRVRQINPWETLYDLVPTVQTHGHTKLKWYVSVSVQQQDLENALGLLLGKRNLGIVNGYWMRITSGQTQEIALIPHNK